MRVQNLIILLIHIKILAVGEIYFIFAAFSRYKICFADNVESKKLFDQSLLIVVVWNFE